MARRPVSVLLLADRLGLHDDGWSIGSFLDRLEVQGVSARVICLEAAGEAARESRLVVSPGLGGRWRQPFAVRGLQLDESVDGPDLLHVLSAGMASAGLAVAEYWELPYLLTVDEFLPPGQSLRLSRGWCRRLIAPRRELAEELRSSYGVPADFVAELPGGIEVPDVEPVSPEGPRVSVIGTAGRLTASSGVSTFLSAARKIVDAGVDAEFVIAGQGEDEVDLRRRADRLRLTDRVTFAGIPVVGLRFWNVLDVFCQPSLVPSVGRNLATALAFGVPAVASDLPGLRGLISHRETGLLTPAGDSSALARAILELLADPALARELGCSGRESIRRDFAPDAEARHLAEIYQDCLSATSNDPTPLQNT